MRMLALTLTMLFIADASLASDGVLEINRACVNTGCFPGDSPGPPVEITQTGSYRLTGNLLSPNGVTAISIESDAVTLDLAGFTVGPCVNVSALCPILAVETGISGAGADRATIRNGIIEKFRGGGILLGAQARVQDVTVRSVQGIGISVGVASLVERCLATEGGASGFAVGANSTLEHNTARSDDNFGFFVGKGSTVRGNKASINGSSGFFIDEGGTVVQNSADFNGGDGFTLVGTVTIPGGGLLQSNTAIENQGFGFDIGSGNDLGTWGLIHNVAILNADGPIRGGLEMGENNCNGGLNCP